MTTYGIISDIHDNYVDMPGAIEKLKLLGAVKLIVNGDLGDTWEDDSSCMCHRAKVLGTLAESGLETFVQPGSHEAIRNYRQVLNDFVQAFPNIIDVTRYPIVEGKDHELLFIPGSDYLCNGEYQLGTELPTGQYILTKEGPVRFTDAETYKKLALEGLVTGQVSYRNIEDIKKWVTDPEKTISICHVPRKFNTEQAVDFAHYVETLFVAPDADPAKGTGLIPGGVAPSSSSYVNKRKGQGVPFFGLDREISWDNIIDAAKDFAKKYELELCPVLIERKENRGNKALAELYRELGINKAVSGHFHESVHRATDRQGNPTPEGESLDELFWNASHLDAGKAGLLIVEDNKVRYHNINLDE